MEHPIEALMRTTMDNLREMIDVNTIVGEPVETHDGTVIIPISKVCIGFASGGTEFTNERKMDDKAKFPFGGGSGAGMTLHPVAFLVVSKDSVKLLPVNQANSIERIIDGVPDLIEEIINYFRKDKKKGDKYVNVEDEGFNAT
ncbi:putative spore protein YtfJ [Caloramator mitchellensis]|uniref:Putative spore protein YtfJ n=1 Tax=Caloramator mitchellensis TaxID=908809 RepID=A0A0R3K1P5_CALMK|nr:GerW family sporulation protein [Caloramator mitchellensis]KRQ86802.1 putative spore protein YtfJ [Caloramator mitchellensis]